MNTIALIGASGYVGSALIAKLTANSEFRVSPVTRANYAEMKKGSYDILIHSAMPSKRFWAKQHPEDDYRETVQKTTELYKEWCYKKFVLISTVSARCESETVYGAHKLQAEKICAAPDDLILRLSAMYSTGLAKGALIDILNGTKVFVSGQSLYPFASLDFVASWIANNLHRSGIIEVGARDSVTLQEIADHLGQQVEFEGPKEDQSLRNPSPDFPEAKEVFKFMDQMAKAGKK